MIVLHYLSNTQRRFSTYMSHRVAEIVSNSSLCECRHIPGTINVADDCTRGKEIFELTPQSRWISGPDFLLQPKVEWPRVEELPVIDEQELEVKGSVLVMSTSPSVCMVQWERYSSWKKLCRHYARWMRFRFNLRCKAKKISPPPERRIEYLSAVDLQEDEDGVIRVGGRLERAPIPFEAKHQVLLSPKHPLSSC